MRLLPLACLPVALLLAALAGLAGTPGDDRPARPAAAATPEIGALLDRLTELKAKRVEIERHEREIIKQLGERLREQQQRIQALGLRLEGPGLERDPRLPHETAEKPAPPPAAAPDEFQAAYDSDRAVGLATTEEVKALSRLFALVGEGLEKAKPPTVGHFKAGLDVLIRAKLKGKAPTLAALAQRNLAGQLPAHDAPLTPQVATAARLAALGIAACLDKINP